MPAAARRARCFQVAIALALTAWSGLTLSSSAMGAVGAPQSLGDERPVGRWPLAPEPAVLAKFDAPRDPWGAGHRGVDLAARIGQPVLAALPGRISFAGVLAGRGVVVVDHGATRTTYEPVVATVSVGAQVGAGDQIGIIELRGSHCLPTACLHWGWLRGQVYLDPLLLVGLGPVRLLPLDGLQRAPATALRPLRPRITLALAARVQALGWACW